MVWWTSHVICFQGQRFFPESLLDFLFGVGSGGQRAGWMTKESAVLTQMKGVRWRLDDCILGCRQQKGHKYARPASVPCWFPGGNVEVVSSAFHRDGKQTTRLVV